MNEVLRGISRITDLPEGAQGIAFLVVFPLTFVSNVFVPTQGMPGGVAAIANWNPVSAVPSACRTLF